MAPLLPTGGTLLRHPIVPRNRTISHSILHHKRILKKGYFLFCISAWNARCRIVKVAYWNYFLQKWCKSQGGSVSIVTTLEAELPRILVTFRIQICSGPAQPPMQWELGYISAGVKRPRREADHAPPSCAEVKNVWSYTFTLPYVFMSWCLIKCGGQL
jgi:hypothetical protein